MKTRGLAAAAAAAVAEPDAASTILSELGDAAARPPVGGEPRGLPPPQLRNRLVVDGPRNRANPGFTRQAVDTVVLARGGGVLLIGWIDDATCPLDAITVSCADWRITFDATVLARVRRIDVEGVLQSGPTHLFGYFGLLAAGNLDAVGDRARIELHLANGGQISTEAATRAVSPAELRDLTLGYLASAQFLANPQAEAVACLEPGLGAQVLALNETVTRRVVAARHVERFGTPRRQPVGSIVVCLYGRAEFLFVQNALFAGLPGIEDYEFVFVCNSPEIADEVTREAKLAQRVYGLAQTVVLLAGNAGFGAANNAAAAAALGRRILAVNPDVFPRDPDWARRHTQLLGSAPAERTRLFGTTLYYDDGSLMHGGMYFELDSAAAISPAGAQAGTIERRRMLRVEHYGKGAPDWAATYARPRPVPAVTGAFISADRAWFERLGGFTEDYIFGHYEDADLCLKSLEQGTPTWLHDLRLWHLEGKGSTRRPHHDGGSLVNRWTFTRRWLTLVSAGLLGPAPAHQAMADAAEAPARRRAQAVPVNAA